MLFNNTQLESILNGEALLGKIAVAYYDENRESVLEEYSPEVGFLVVKGELSRQVNEYGNFNYKKATCVEELETIKTSLKLTNGFKDLEHLYNSIQQFKGKEVYFTLFNAFNDEIVGFVEKVVSLYGDALKDCMMYRGLFDSYYYTYFIENEEIEEDDVICFMIDRVTEWIKE